MESLSSNKNQSVSFSKSHRFQILIGLAGILLFTLLIFVQKNNTVPRTAESQMSESKVAAQSTVQTPKPQNYESLRSALNAALAAKDPAAIKSAVAACQAFMTQHEEDESSAVRLLAYRGLIGLGESAKAQRYFWDVVDRLAEETRKSSIVNGGSEAEARHRADETAWKFSHAEAEKLLNDRQYLNALAIADESLIRFGHLSESIETRFLVALYLDATNATRDAIDAFESLTSHELPPVIVQRAYPILTRLYAKAGDLVTAKERWQQFARRFPTDENKACAQFNIGTLNAALNRKVDALSAYLTVLKDHPKAGYAKVAEQKLGQLREELSDTGL